MTGSPVIYNGVVDVGVSSNEEAIAATQGYPCCAFSGSVVAVDEGSGTKLWQTYMAPSGYSGAAVWSSTPVIDAARNSVYVGTGNNYSVPQVVETCFANNQNNPDCAASNDYFDSVVALDLTTGAIKWATPTMYYDVSNDACDNSPSGQANCPSPQGPDYDFGGSGPNMLGPDLIGIGQKSGIYWALNPDKGTVVWQTRVGPGSGFGGIEWGTAFDGTSIYVPIANWEYLGYSLQPGGANVNGGSWAALNPSTGQILWQTATPGSCSPAVSGYEQGCMALGPPSVANGSCSSARWTRTRRTRLCSPSTRQPELCCGHMPPGARLTRRPRYPAIPSIAVRDILPCALGTTSCSPFRSNRARQ
jgi:polyvinyl alcohol dehydrogenase (cytochrome)